jgi:hypothetical protein
MIRASCAAAAVLVVAGFTTPALAQKKSGGSSLAAIQIECFKAQGAYLDPASKRLIMHGTEMDMQSKTDAVNRCVAEKTGKPATPFVQQQQLNQ